MSRYEDRISAPPALPPIKPPRGRGGWWDDNDPAGDPKELPLWVKPRANLGPIARVGVKFVRGRDRRCFGAQSLPLTTCVVLKVIPPGARRAASMMAPTGYYKSRTPGWSLPGPKRIPKFKTKAEKHRHSKRWLHGFTREREYLLRGPGLYTFAAARNMMEKTRWETTVRLRIKTDGDTLNFDSQPRDLP